MPAFASPAPRGRWSPSRNAGGAASNVAFARAPFVMSFGPALYTVAR